MNFPIAAISFAVLGFGLGVIVAGAIAQAHFTRKHFRTRRSYRIEKVDGKQFTTVGRITIEYDLAEREGFFFRDVCRMFPDKIIIDEPENF